MRTLFALLLLTSAALAQVHCDPSGCAPIQGFESGDPRAPRLGEAPEQYGMRVHRQRQDRHKAYRESLQPKEPQQ